MPAIALPSGKYADLLVAAFGLVLLTAPAWVGALHVGDSGYRYERARVVVDDEDGLAYASDDQALGELPVSTAVACSIPDEARTCALERAVDRGRTIPTTLYGTNPDYAPHSMDADRYRYVELNGSTYATVYVPNRSVRNDDGLYRYDLGLRPTPPRNVLRSVSVEADDAPPAIARAARSGSAVVHRRLAVPETPVRTDGGRYYRVYLDGRTEPSPLAERGAALLTFGGPLVGAGLLWRVIGHVNVRYDPG